MSDEVEGPSAPARRAARVAWRFAQFAVMVAALVYVATGCFQQRFWQSPMLSLTCPLAIPLLMATVWYTLVRFWRAAKETRGHTVEAGQKSSQDGGRDDERQARG